jgi:hypothetical protein
MPATLEEKLNYIEVRVSSSVLEVYASDHSTDGGDTFPNFRRIWAGAISAPLTRGYVHFAARNHATVKYGFPETHVLYWRNCGFDGPGNTAPRAYEIPDNTTLGTSTDSTELDYPYEFANLGLEISDGSGRAEGLYDPTTLVSPLTIPAVDLTGMAVAKLTLNLFVNSQSHTADTTWGLRYKFNTNGWRTRNFTADEAAAANVAGSAGNLMLVVPVEFSDLVSGDNTLDISTVNAPMDYVPVVQNVNFLLSAS